MVEELSNCVTRDYNCSLKRVAQKRVRLCIAQANEMYVERVTNVLKTTKHDAFRSTHGNSSGANNLAHTYISNHMTDSAILSNHTMSKENHLLLWREFKTSQNSPSAITIVMADRGAALLRRHFVWPSWPPLVRDCASGASKGWEGSSRQA